MFSWNKEWMVLLSLTFDTFCRWYGNFCKQSSWITNIDKTKVVIFKKGGRIPNDIEFLYDGKRVDVVNKFNYLVVVFSSGGSFSIAQSTISGQALKAVFKMNTYLYKFTELSVSHEMDLFDKLITPILNCAMYGVLVMVMP